MDLSIVIPVYNESRKVADDVLAASGFIAQANLRGEVIIADDGSIDATAHIAAATAPADGVRLEVLRLTHAGKGSAVRQGMLHTRGQFVMFADSGVCIPYTDALAGLAMLRQDQCDIAHGSRRLPQSVISRPQSAYRSALSRLFRAAMHQYLQLPDHITDTQCGFKLYKGHLGRELYAACQTNGFTFDLEILSRALNRGLRVAEFAVRWRWDTDSRLHPLRILPQVLQDLRRIRHIEK